MKYHKLILLSLLLLTCGMAQDKPEQSEKALDDVIVKETFEAGTEEEKLPISLKADFSNLVEIPERIHWSSVEWKYNDGQPTTSLFQCNLSDPELTRIAPAPAKVFHLSFKDLASWKIDIFTSDGRNFRSLSGEGDPPPAISWDGLDNEGNPLIPGAHYSYSFTATDKAGNRRTFPGEAFTVPALYLVSDEEIWIGLANSTLFSPEGYGLTRDAAELSEELVSFIYYYATDENIRIRSQHPDTGKFLEMLAGKLGRSTDVFTQDSAPTVGNQCFMMWID
ncbi:MAG: hypothetical protein JXL67_13580 [Calditrichaeota bacterium]|nr:hypothetical protein [Calditrichota bacterium]